MRTDRGDGTTGNQVGTKQADEFKSHVHDTGIGQDLYGYSGGVSLWDITATGQKYTHSTGGNETRPRNVYVMWCIKY